MTRKIRQGGQWVQVGGAGISGIEVIADSDDATDLGKLYFITNDSTSSSLTTFRVNGKLGTGIMFDGSELWAPSVQATGGIESIINVSGTPNRVHTFNSNFDFEVLVSTLSVEYLVVGGGGGGGNKPVTNYSGAGGGAGGMINGSNLTLNQGVYSIVVGNGGSPGNKGEDSSIGNLIVAVGGGRGGSNSAGQAGGSGGGAGASNNFGTGIAGQGFNGGSTTNTGPVYLIGAGGGGAGSVGSSISTSAANTPRANGGLGATSLISGNSKVYATGGKGGAGSSHAEGNLNGENGVPNLGNGGGGAGAGTNASLGGSGGSGIVIIRYPIA